MASALLDGSLLWTGALALTGCIFLVYLLGFVVRNRRDRQRFSEAVRLGIEKPVAQYPYVDASRCIGCGTCVRACPEGDVLGIVGGTAVVVNGLRCVGHAHCETACPVDAIRVGLGPIRERADVPLLDETYESTVPGVFVVGELGGLSLISNAVTQASQAVKRIAEWSWDRPSQEGSVDIAIIGAGPAGIAAAMAAVETGLSHAVFEQEGNLGGTLLHYPRRKLVLTQTVDLPLGARIRKEEYRKEDLLALFEDLVQRHALDVRFGERVGDVERVEGGFRIHTAAGTSAARYLVLAMGRRGTPRRLGVPGEDLSKVLYQLRDAESYRKRRILCVGGGDSAVEAAMGLAGQPGNEVTISYRREKFVRIKKKNQAKLEKMLKRRRLRAVLGSRVVEIRPDSVALAVGDERLSIDNDDVFVLIGGEPAWPLLGKLDIAFGGEQANR